jgi:hypothetical protein
MKKRRRTPRPALIPRAFLLKLSADQVRDLSIAHHTHVDLVASGKGTPDLLWEMACAALGWSCMAQALGMGEAEMATDMGVVEALLDRYSRTGRVVYTGTELQLARQGLDVVDQLARQVDRYTALAAITWAEDEINRRRDAWALARNSGTANVQNHSTQATMQTEARAA